MNNPDLINGLFELLGAIFAWKNVQALHRHKSVRGVYWPATAFFSAWGIWNLFYYPSLAQMFSFYGGLVLVMANVVWVVMAVAYRNRSVIGSEL